MKAKRLRDGTGGGDLDAIADAMGRDQGRRFGWESSLTLERRLFLTVSRPSRAGPPAAAARAGAIGDALAQFLFTIS
jgi:hypothetical protein